LFAEAPHSFRNLAVPAAGPTLSCACAGELPSERHVTFLRLPRLKVLKAVADATMWKERDHQAGRRKWAIRPSWSWKSRARDLKHSGRFHRIC